MAIIENPRKDCAGMMNTNSAGFKELCRHQYMDSMYKGELDNGLLTVLIAFPHLSKQVKASMGVRHTHNLARAIVYDDGRQYLMLWHRSSKVAELYEVLWDPDDSGSYKLELSWMSKAAAYSLTAIWRWLDDYGHGANYKAFAPRKSPISQVNTIRCVHESQIDSSEEQII